VTPLARNSGSIPARETHRVRPAGADGPPTVRVAVYSPSNAPSGLHVTPPPPPDRKIVPSFSTAEAGHNCVGAAGEARFPRAGEMLLGFRLVEELGRGAFARVFLAHQEALAGRPVVLKVSLRPTREAERLARLQHTNVVPVYSVHDATPVQIICMPFLGRRTVADLIRKYRTDNPSGGLGTRKTSGLRPDRTTDYDDRRSDPTAEPGPFAPPPADGPPLPPLVGDPRAVLRLLVQLADGLAHAHARGILHLDLKPANVLLADSGEPMLFDFNLSFDAADRERGFVGGTVPYMAIEQLIDLKSRGKGDIDTRTDLYSLGVMAFEMLTGTVPFPANGPTDVAALVAARRRGAPSLRELNPAVSPALEAIVRKLLAPGPADRYQSAEDVKTDLQRQLDDLPLAVVREPSVRERFAKWRRRNPGVFRRGLVACLLGLAVGLAVASHKRAEAGAKLQALGRARVTHSALDPVRLDLAVPGDPAARTRGVARAGEILAEYGLPDDPDWAKRDNVRRLAEADRAALSADLGELLLLLGQVRWQDVKDRPEDRGAVAAEVLKLNRAARTCFAPGAAPPLLDRQAAELTLVLGKPREPAARDADRQPAARDLFLEASSAMSAGRFSAAVPQLEKVLAERPQHAAAHYCLAYCRQQLGDCDRALERYGDAERLLPADPRPAFQRGVIYGLKGNHQKAEEEFTTAIKLDGEYAAAFRNRGFARFRTEQFEEAEADFTAALDRGAPPIQVYLYRAQVREKLKNADGAAADRRAAARLSPEQEGDYIARGMANLKANPEEALADFRAAAERNPRSLAALKNQIHVLADRLERTEDALAAATRLTECYPDSAQARVTRAVLLARLGRRDDAHAEAEKARRLSKDADITYRAACVYALTSAAHPGDQTKALDLLRKAVKDGPHAAAGIRTSRDLKPLHDSPQFREIAAAVASLYQ
jgi:serine/threonine protein kinase/tetratricopeptide (TPR) repeat protein